MPKLAPRIILISSVILVGLLYVLPPLSIWRHFRAQSQPFVLAQLETYKDELTVYLPRAREIYDGHFPPKDLYFNEQRPTVLNPLPPLMFSVFIFLAGGNINIAYLMSQFFFAAVIFLLFYFLGRQLFRSSKLWSLLFAFVGVLTPISFIYYRWGLASDFWGNVKDIIAVVMKQFVPIINTPIHKMFLARVDDPLITYPVYLSAIFLFFVFWRRPSLKKAIFAAVPAGLLFYTYFHYWVYWVIVLGIFFAYSAFNFSDDRARFKYFSIFIFVVFLLSIPYFVNYFSVSQLPDHQDYTFRFGLATGRSLEVLTQFKYQYLVYLLLGFLVWVVYRAKDAFKWILYSGLIAAMFFSTLIQLVVGFMPVPGQVTKPIALIVFIVLFDVFYTLFKIIFADNQLPRKTGMIILLILIVLVPLKKVVNVAVIFKSPEKVAGYYSFSKDIVDSWKWINQNLEREPKIVSSSLITSLYLATYTSGRPFLATGFASAMPMRVIEERYLAANKLFGVEPDVLRKRLTGDSLFCNSNCPKDSEININKTPRFLYVNYFASGKKVLGGDSAMPRAYLAEVMAKYNNINIKEIQADYVYYGPLERQFSRPNLETNPNLTLVYSNPSVVIYKILK